MMSPEEYVDPTFLTPSSCCNPRTRTRRIRSRTCWLSGSSNAHQDAPQLGFPVPGTGLVVVPLHNSMQQSPVESVMENAVPTLKSLTDRVRPVDDEYFSSVTAAVAGRLWVVEELLMFSCSLTLSLPSTLRNHRLIDLRTLNQSIE